MNGRTKNLRLHIVGVAFALVTLSLWGRLVQVQVFGQAHYDSLAAMQGIAKRDVPAVRGCVFDRSGRPLALSVHSFSVAVQPSQIVEKARVEAALVKYLSAPKKDVREKIRSDKTFVYVKRRCPLSKDAQATLKKLAGVVVEPEADRVYPFGATAAKIVGFVGIGNKGMAGIEGAFDGELAGTPGWEEVQRDGCYRARGYQTFAEQEPVHGKHVFLTIDARIQEIAEMELHKAVADSKAKGGVVLVMERKTGDVLAAAESPSPESRGPKSRADSLWTLRSVSCVYEPGSTFKLITAAALLESGKVRGSDVFDAEKGEAKVGVATIRDAHPFDHLTFREGFVQSSNVVFAKASTRLTPQEFVEYINLFGFGAPTGIELRGESAGRIAPVSRWSKRTQITMAFGQEIAVTPLQITAAFATVANDGILVMPRLVRSVADETVGVTEAARPVELRRVISESTARVLKDYLRSVVVDGTGKAAGLEFLETAGKTGTGEKSAARGGYIPGAYMASFVGFAPVEDPKVVCLVLLDEPNWENRFGGVSAAPVFARIMEALASSSHIFDDVLEREPVGDDGSGGQRFVAPNFLRMSHDVVMERARMLDLNLLCKGESGDVIAQDPDPGVAIDRDDVVRVYLSGASDEGEGKGKETPDVMGMPLRAARRFAAEAGFKCEVTGSGFVVSQSPAPGEVSKGAVIRIHCDAAAPEKQAG
jgi:stage V sporulation protein D (sporulation-specific penicillin-binding protein)